MGGSLGSAAVLVPCTCGELVQGSLGGRPFLVSCPIDRYSRVEVTLESSCQLSAVSCQNGAHSVGEEAQSRSGRRGTSPRPTADLFVTSCLRGSPLVSSSYPKAERAVGATLDFLGIPDAGFRLEVACPLPPSKGFGTSTADVVGAIVATAAAAGARIDPLDVARLAVSVEPSDGTMFTGLARFDHRGATVAEPLGPAPSLTVAVLEFDGTVDTLEFNARLRLSVLRDAERDHERALDLLRHGLRSGRLDWIGQAATLSARANQRLLPKRELEAVIELAEAGGALGVCAAHSGTALGVLFAPGETARANGLLATARAKLDGLLDGWISTMVDGGARMPSGEITEPRRHEGHEEARMDSSLV